MQGFPKAFNPPFSLGLWAGCISTLKSSIIRLSWVLRSVRPSSCSSMVRFASFVFKKKTLGPVHTERTERNDTNKSEVNKRAKHNSTFIITGKNPPERPLYPIPLFVYLLIFLVKTPRFRAILLRRHDGPKVQKPCQTSGLAIRIRLVHQQGCPTLNRPDTFKYPAALHCSSPSGVSLLSTRPGSYLSLGYPFLTPPSRPDVRSPQLHQVI